MLREQFKQVTTTFIDDDMEEGKYTVIYTDIGEVQVFKTLEETMEEIKDCKDNKKLFRYKRLEEYSPTLKHFGEFIIDLENTKILGYKEHHIIDNLKLQRELKEKKEAEELLDK